jgi:hypothetical protein
MPLSSLQHLDAQEPVRRLRSSAPPLRFSRKSDPKQDANADTEEGTDGTEGLKVKNPIAASKPLNAEEWESGTDDESSLSDASASEALGETFRCLNHHAMSSQAKASFEHIRWRQAPAVAMQRIDNDEIASCAKASLEKIQWRQALAVPIQHQEAKEPVRCLRRNAPPLRFSRKSDPKQDADMKEGTDGTEGLKVKNPIAASKPLNAEERYIHYHTSPNASVADAEMQIVMDEILAALRLARGSKRVPSTEKLISSSTCVTEQYRRFHFSNFEVLWTLLPLLLLGYLAKCVGVK